MILRAVLFILMTGCVIDCRKKNPVIKQGIFKHNRGIPTRIFGSLDNYFNAVAIDSEGAIVRAGSWYYTASHSNMTVQKAYIAKNIGDRQGWSVFSSSANDKPAEFRGVAVDGSGNVYAAGMHEGKMECKLFLGGSTVNPQVVNGASSGANFLLVKYNKSGEPQWARTSVAAESFSEFNSIAVDDYGDIYVAGSQGMGTLDLGGVKTFGPASVNILVARFDAAGNVKWARTAKSADRPSSFSAVAVSKSGAVYAAGRHFGEYSGKNTYGDFTLDDPGKKDIPLLIKYDDSGDVVSAYIAGTKSASAEFRSVAIDSDENVYVAGSFDGDSPVAVGSHIVTATPGINSLLAKFDKEGQPLWARHFPDIMVFGLAVDSAFNLYAAGEGVSGTGISAGGEMIKCRDRVANLVKFNKDGNPVWRRSQSCDVRNSFTGVATTGDGSVVAVGFGKNLNSMIFN